MLVTVHTHGCLRVHLSMNAHCVHVYVSMCTLVPVSGRGWRGGLCAGLETGWALLLSCLHAGINASGGQQVEKESHCESGSRSLWAAH